MGDPPVAELVQKTLQDVQNINQGFDQLRLDTKESLASLSAIVHLESATRKEEFAALRQDLLQVLGPQQSTVTPPNQASGVTGHLSAPITGQNGQVGAASPLPDRQDIQGHFQAIKDNLQKVRLDSELKLNESRQNLKREDQGAFNLVCKSARDFS